MARAATPALSVRILVTIAVVLLVVLGDRVHAPGLYRGALDDALWPSVFAIGLAPVVSAYFLVEVVAAIVPRWRALRHGGPARRARLDFFVGIVATAIAIVHVFGIAVYLPTINPNRTVFLPGMGMVLFIASLVAGTFVLWIAARACNRYGLVNGYVLILCASIVPSAVERTAHALAAPTSDPVAGWLLVSTIAVGAIASLVAFAFVGPIRRAPRREVESYRIAPAPRPPQHPWIPVPVSSLQPYAIAGASIMMPAVLSNLGIGGLQGLSVYVASPGGQLAVLVVLTLVVTYVFGAIFFRPARVARDLEHVQPDPPQALADIANVELRRSMIATILLMGGISAASWAAARAAHRVSLGAGVDAYSPLGAIGGTLVPLLVALVLDAVDAVRFHRRDRALVCVWEERRAHLVYALRDALILEGCPAHVRNARTFSLFQFFGPYAPAELWVPAKEASGARELLTDLVAGEGVFEPPEDAPEPPADPVPAWFARLQLPALALAIVAGLVLGWSATRVPADPSISAPPVALQIVRVDDSFDPLAGEVSGLPTGASIQNELAPTGITASGSVQQSPVHYLRLVVQPSETVAQAEQRAAAWAIGVPLPDEHRFAFGDTRDSLSAPAGKIEALRSYLLTGGPILTNADIEDAQVALDANKGPTPEYYVAITLRAEGAQRFGVATAGWVKRRLAIVLDGRVDTAPVVQSAITGGHISITLGNASGDRAAQLQAARRLAVSLGGR